VVVDRDDRICNAGAAVSLSNKEREYIKAATTTMNSGERTLKSFRIIVEEEVRMVVYIID